MKKFIFTFLIAILSIAAIGALSTSSPLFAKNTQIRGTHQKTTGEFVGYAGTYVHMIVAAHDTNKGNVYYHRADTDQYFVGEVTCYGQDTTGKYSVFAGVITEENYPKDKTFFQIFTRDRGEGVNADGPDAFRVLFTTATTMPYDCEKAITTTYPATVMGGNIQIHNK